MFEIWFREKQIKDHVTMHPILDNQPDPEPIKFHNIESARQYAVSNLRDHPAYAKSTIMYIYDVAKDAFINV